MKTLLRKKLPALILTLLFLVMYIPSMPTYASQNVLYRDFEGSDYVIGKGLPKKDISGFTVWRGDTILGDAENKYLSLTRTMPMADGETFGSDNNSTNGRVAIVMDSEPGDKVIVSVDFQMPVSPNDYSADIFGIMSKNSNKYSAGVRLENGALYEGRLASTPVLRNDLVANKWYHAFLVLDLVNDTYKLYCGKYESEERAFEQPVTEPVDRFFGPRMRSINTPLYMDNLDISVVTHNELDVALYKVRSILLETNVGYENGQYPQTAYNMLKSVYDDIKENENTLSDSEKTEKAEQLNNAFNAYKNSKIDETAAETDPCYIVFDMPSEVAVSETNEYTCSLAAKVYDRAGRELNDEITWSIEKGLDGVTVSGNELTAEAGTLGEVKLKATCGTIYDTHTLLLSKGKTVDKLVVSAENGKLKAEGKLSAVPDSDVNISVTGEEGGAINASGKLTVDKNANFYFETSVASDTPYQDLTVKIEGLDTAQYVKTGVFFYGVGWEEKVLGDFNGASSEAETGKFWEKYSVGVGADYSTYSAYKDNFQAEFFAKKQYAKISDLQKVAKETACVADFVLRKDLTKEEAFLNNIEVLTANGFDTVSYEAMDDTQKVVFYEELAAISFTSSNIGVSDISESINKFLKDLNSGTEADAEGATKTIFKDDFESYEADKRLSSANYGLQQGCFVGKEGENQFLKMQREQDYESGESFGSDHSYNARITKEFTDEPAEEIITSIDFMMPEDPQKYSAEIFGIMSDNGNYYATNTRIEKGTLYKGRLSGSGALAENLRAGKWYNAFMCVDLVNNKYKLYFGDTSTDLLSFQGKVVEKTNRLFMIRVRNYDEPFYFDNVDISEIKYKDLAIALYSARSVLVNSDVGTNAGQHPKTAYSMLENTYETVLNATKISDLTEEKAEKYTNTVNAAITAFKNNKIISGASDGKVSYITFDLPNAWGVESTSAVTYELLATAFDHTNTAINSRITWTTAKNYKGVSISGNSLTVQGGTYGEIVLRATVGDVYDTHTILLTSFKKITNVDVDSRGGQIKVSGKFDDLPYEAANIKITSSDLNLSGTLTVNEDKTFEWNANVDADIQFGDMTVEFFGNDVSNKTSVVPFYGKGWEAAVLSDFNNTTNAAACGSVTEKYYVSTGIDYAELKTYEDVYKSRLYGAKPYRSFADLTNAVKEIQLVTAFYEVNRDTVAELFEKHMETLTRCGFDEESFNAFDDDLKGGVYTTAQAIEVELDATTAYDIVELLNARIDEINENEPVKGNEGNTGNNSHKGGGGGGSYSVSLKGNSSQVEAPLAETSNETEQFADAYLAEWAKDALLYMRKAGIMNGDGTNVRPTDAVTRGEFSKILVTAFKLEANGEEHYFADGEDAWWNEYAQIMYSNEIMSGVGDNVFGGEMPITRQMLAVAVDRLIKAKGIEIYDKNSGIEFKDGDVIADYAKDSVSFLAKKGIIQGIGNDLFAPELAVTRAEAAQIIYNILKQM